MRLRFAVALAACLAAVATASTPPRLQARPAAPDSAPKPFSLACNEKMVERMTGSDAGP